MGWHCKATGGYALDISDGAPCDRYPDPMGFDNMDQFYYILRQRRFNWTTQAIVGVMVCIGFESRYNPWSWEGTIVPSTTNYTGSTGNKGYGLVQWTPGSYLNTQNYHKNKYIDNPYTVGRPGYAPNFSDHVGGYFDGYAQTVFLATKAWSIDGGINKDYYEYNALNYYSHLAPTFFDYIASTADPWELCETWVLNFERPSNPTANRSRRQDLAHELWNRYRNKPVLRPDYPPGAGFPVWLLFKFLENNFGRK